MKTKLPKILLLLLVLAGFLTSCDSEFKVSSSQKDGVQVEFAFDIGPAVEKMMVSLLDAPGELLIDRKALADSLVGQGYKNVKVDKNGRSGVRVSLTENRSNSYLFTSGLIGDKTITLSPAILLDFYKACDEESRALLDLLISPIFNEEEMSEEEYLDTISGFYGKDVAAEFKSSHIKISTEKGSYQISLIKLLTLDEILTF